MKFDLSASTCWFWYRRHEEHMRLQGSSLLFALRASLRVCGRTAQSAPKGGVETFARLFLPMAGRLRRGGLLWFAPLSCPTLRLTTLRGGKSISGCVCPRLDLRKGGLYVTTERGGNTCWAEAQRCGTAQQSRAERRGAVRERRLTIRQLEERTLTNPYGCLRNTDQSPLPPLFSFSGTFGF